MRDEQRSDRAAEYRAEWIADEHRRDRRAALLRREMLCDEGDNRGEKSPESETRKEAEGGESPE